MNFTNITFIFDSSTQNIDSWLIPLDIVNIICLILVIILSIIFLLFIAIDKTCHTVPMLLVANSCLAELVFASNSLAMTAFALKNDLKQIQYQDALCIFRGYMNGVSGAALNHSFLLQAIYRYVIVVYPARLFWQRARTQLFLICIIWVYAIIFSLPLIFTGDFTYNFPNQVCLAPLRLSFAIIYLALLIYLIPVSLVMSIYIKLARHVKEMSRRAISANILIRAQRELKMFRRLVILIIILVILGAPYTAFDLMGFFTSPPKYHFRIALHAIHVALACVIIALFQFNEPLKASVRNFIHGGLNIIRPMGTLATRATDA